MPGARIYGFHEGSRSEYLAQYVFASWGTAVVIPQQEDHGLDLHCTLMERIGGRFLAKSPYTVQVKSTIGPVVFEGKEAVRWVIEHPLPLFLCIVDKARGRISIYHTLARFYIWSHGQWPDRLLMIPAPAIPGKEGTCSQWTGSTDLSLDQPILDFSVTEMLDESFWQKAKQVFEHWVEVENDNLTRVRGRLLACRVPHTYKTNDSWVGGWTTISASFPDNEQFYKTAAGLKESFEWVCEQLLRKNDLEGTAKAALFHRHLFPVEDCNLIQCVQPALNKQLGKNSYVYAGVDYLAEVVQKVLKADSAAAH